MIRQLETPWQSRALIILDPRAARYVHAAAFEKAVRGAASVVHHLYEYGFESDLWAGGETISSSDQNSYERAMETLAAVQMVPEADLRHGAARLRHSGRGGALVLITGSPDQDTLRIHRLLSKEYTRTILMGTTHGEIDLSEYQQDGVFTVVIRPEEAWAPTWMQSMRGKTWTPASTTASSTASAG